MQWLCRELEVLSGPEKEVGSVLDYITELDGIPLITEPRAEMAQRATVAAMQAGLPEARIGMGCLFYLMEEYTEAKSWLKSALRCQKDPEENAERTAALHLYLGLSCCGEWYDDDGKAIEFLQISYDRYTALAQSDSGSEWLLPRIICANRLGALYLKKKNMEQAEQWGEIMVELSKQLDKPVGTEYTGLQLFGACYWMGRLCFQLKRNDEAVRWMQRSCKYGIRAAQKTGARKLLLLMDKALHDPAVLRSRWDCLEAGQTRSYYVGIVRRKLQELGVTP